VSLSRDSGLRPPTMNNRSWNDHLAARLMSGANPRRSKMKLAVIAFSAAALIASSPTVFAQDTSSKAPGQEMQTKGSVKGTTGASGYAPGHIMHHRKHAKLGTHGASGYAPGHQTTTGMVKSKSTTGMSKSTTGTSKSTTGTSTSTKSNY
jgi:hypothetical protein